MTFAFDRARHDRAAHRRPQEWRDGARVLVLGGEHVATAEGPRLRWMDAAEAPEGEWVLLGEQAGTTYGAVVVDRVPADLAPLSVRALALTLTPDELSLAVHAVALARWLGAHRFCPRCGTDTEVQQSGHLRVCPACGGQQFPRTDPAVIMLITDQDDRALLGHQASWPEGRFSTLAGFVEPGEALEDAVRREVLEEAGIVVGDVRYAASQPWPFPSSLMLGFFGTALTTDIDVTDDELADARWFSREEILAEAQAERIILPPPGVSISRWLVEQWYGGPLPGAWS